MKDEDLATLRASQIESATPRQSLHAQAAHLHVPPYLPPSCCLPPCVQFALRKRLQSHGAHPRPLPKFRYLFGFPRINAQADNLDNGQATILVLDTVEMISAMSAGCASPTPRAIPQSRRGELVTSYLGCSGCSGSL